MNPLKPPILSITSELENKALKYNAVHKSWGMLTLKATPLENYQNPPSLPVDFVVVIDTSASMRVDSKLAFVQATIEYLLSKLDENQTFSLVAFNHEITTLTKLQACTPHNKANILELVKCLQASGSTNISEALFTGTRILLERDGCLGNRISTLMLFTDGLSNQGLSSHATLQSLRKVSLPPGCIFNTFGFGADHDSKLLSAIALRSQGVYYYVERREDIASTFGECVAGILTTRAHQITVRMRCRDGARLVTIATPFNIKEHTVAKDYEVNLELVYRGESKSILFRLSLRAMNKPMQCHHLIDLDVEYIDTLTGKKERTSVPIKVIRPDMPLLERMPVDLDRHINRYSAATTITESIDLAKKCNFLEAQQKLRTLVQKIKKSVSGNEPYCEDLIKDVQDCISGMSDTSTFQTGQHSAHAYCSMYFMERSCGLKNREKSGNQSFVRHLSYGYRTADQDFEAQRAVNLARAYVRSYVDCQG